MKKKQFGSTETVIIYIKETLLLSLKTRDFLKEVFGSDIKENGGDHKDLLHLYPFDNNLQGL